MDDVCICRTFSRLHVLRYAQVFSRSIHSLRHVMKWRAFKSWAHTCNVMATICCQIEFIANDCIIDATNYCVRFRPGSADRLCWPNNRPVAKTGQNESLLNTNDAFLKVTVGDELGSNGLLR